MLMEAAFLAAYQTDIELNCGYCVERQHDRHYADPCGSTRLLDRDEWREPILGMEGTLQGATRMHSCGV